MRMCQFPLIGWKDPMGAFTFRRRQAWDPETLGITIACGQCVDCKVRRTREWATRIQCEAHTTAYPADHCWAGCSPTTWCTHRESIFLTLTLAPEFLGDGSLHKRQWQLFAKRLRKAVGRFRFFACGEYGDLKGRPHYHAIIFGQGFLEDRKPWRRKGKVQYFRSATLEACWTDPETGRPFGTVEFSDVSIGAAEYVAKYTLKRRAPQALDGTRRENEGPLGLGPYVRPHPMTGDPVEVEREFALMSRRPGIGAEWSRRFGSEAVADDTVVVSGPDGEAKRRPVPRFYRTRFAESFPEWSDALNAERAAKAEADRRAAIKAGLSGTKAIFDLMDSEARERGVRKRLSGGGVDDV